MDSIPKSLMNRLLHQPSVEVGAKLHWFKVFKNGEPHRAVSLPEIIDEVERKCLCNIHNSQLKITEFQIRVHESILFKETYSFEVGRCEHGQLELQRFSADRLWIPEASSHFHIKIWEAKRNIVCLGDTLTIGFLRR